MYRLVCESFLRRFENYAGDRLNNLDDSETALKEFCNSAVPDGKDESFVSLLIILNNYNYFLLIIIVLLCRSLGHVCNKNRLVSYETNVIRKAGREDLQRFKQERCSNL